MTPMMFPVTGVFTGALALLLVARSRTKISLGAEADQTLNEAARVFGLDAARPVTVARIVGMMLTWAAIGLGALALLGQALGMI